LQSLRLQQRSRFLIKRNKRITTQPAALKGDHAVCKAASGLQHGKARLYSGSINLHINGRCERFNSLAKVQRFEVIDSQQNPYKLAQTEQRDVNALVHTEGYGISSEYLRKLIRQDQDKRSPRYSQERGLSGSQFWGLGKFPFSLFYIEQADCLWVIRLLHMSRGIPASLQD